MEISPPQCPSFPFIPLIPKQALTGHANIVGLMLIFLHQILLKKNKGSKPGEAAVEDAATENDATEEQEPTSDSIKDEL
jgi:hypothetical protein